MTFQVTILVEHKSDILLLNLCLSMIYPILKITDAYENLLLFCSGRWRKRKRYGAGLISGKALEARGVKEIWGKYQSGVLEGPAKVTLAHGDCILEGNFVNGKLHGPVRGLTKRGRHHFSKVSFDVFNLSSSKIEHVSVANFYCLIFGILRFFTKNDKTISW